VGEQRERDVITGWLALMGQPRTLTLRGWSNPQRQHNGFLPPATRDLPEWALRAQLHIEGVDTGRVCFHPLKKPKRYHPPEKVEPLALEQIPPLVFSEIMREVDLITR
jgi:hypothetical protein